MILSWAYWECLRILFIMQSYIKIIETLLSHSYGYAVIFPQSETEYAFFTGISELVNYVEPLSFIPVAIFLCAYVVYWIEVTCNKKTGE